MPPRGAPVHACSLSFWPSHLTLFAFRCVRLHSSLALHTATSHTFCATRWVAGHDGRTYNARSTFPFLWTRRLRIDRCLPPRTNRTYCNWHLCNISLTTIQLVVCLRMTGRGLRQTGRLSGLLPAVLYLRFEHPSFSVCAQHGHRVDDRTWRLTFATARRDHSQPNSPSGQRAAFAGRHHRQNITGGLAFWYLTRREFAGPNRISVITAFGVHAPATCIRGCSGCITRYRLPRFAKMVRFRFDATSTVA